MLVMVVTKTPYSGIYGLKMTYDIKVNTILRNQLTSCSIIQHPHLGNYSVEEVFLFGIIIT